MNLLKPLLLIITLIGLSACGDKDEDDTAGTEESTDSGS